MKKILITCFLSVLSLTSFAQEEERSSNILPKKGDFLGSLLLGRGQFPRIYGAPANNASSISAVTPTTSVTDDNSNSFINMIGAEGRYFVTNDIAIKLSAGFLTANTPGREQIEGTLDTTGFGTNVPTINSVEGNVTTQLRVEVGGEYHFKLDSKRLSPYVGLSVPFYYSKDKELDPGFNIIGNQVNDINGARTAVLLGIGSQTFAGVDYYFNKDIYFGVQINAVGYEYAFLQQSTGGGLPVAKSSTHGINFGTSPLVKIGFKF